MEKAFLQSIHEHQAIIYKVCKLYRDSPEDQEDLFQEIVYQLWKSYSSFRGDSKMSSWIYRIALNTAMVVYRKGKVSVQFPGEFPEQMHPHSNKEASGSDERIYWALRQLNDSEKALVSLYLDDFTYQEIAEMSGISENNVGVRLNRIKNKLKNIIK